VLRDTLQSHLDLFLFFRFVETVELLSVFLDPQDPTHPVPRDLFLLFW